MANLYFTIHTLALNTQLPCRLYTFIYITKILLHSFILTFTSTISATPQRQKTISHQMIQITNLMVSHCDCEKQHNLRQFNLINAKQCTEAPSNIQHASVKARDYVRAKAKRIKAYKCVAYAKKERKICFQGSVKYRRVDRTGWNRNTMPLPVTLDPSKSKNMIGLNGTNNKISNNLHYNKIFTLLADHFFQGQLKQFQTPFTVCQLNKTYTGTFIFMPADKDWIYDPTRNPYYNFSAHHQFEVNLVSWRLEISEEQRTFDDTENVMIIDGHILPCYFADGLCKPATKTPFTLGWFSDEFFFIFLIQAFFGRMTKIQDIGLKQILLYTLRTQQNLKQHLALKVQHILMYMLHIYKTQILVFHKSHIQILVLHVLKCFQMVKRSVVNMTLFILHTTLIFL